MEVENSRAQEFCTVIDTMTASVTSTREVLSSFHSNKQSLSTKEGISLLSLKHHVLLFYLRSLALISSRRALGHTLQTRSLPAHPFSATTREARGSGSGDLVDSMVESRIVLEKIETLESRMRYQIEKLVRLAEEPGKQQNIVDDPLAFRPNPRNLVNDQGEEPEDQPNYSVLPNKSEDDHDRIYRPPRLAPMPYTEKSKSQTRKERPPIPSALATLSSDPSRPHVETTSGLGGMPALASGRAGYLKRLKDFEEENFTRMIMKKTDARRRARDEADLALGGDLGGAGGGRRRAGGLEDEFGDVLRSVDRVSRGQGQGDGYEELRRKGSKAGVLDRIRRSDNVRTRDDAFDMGEEDPDNRRMKKRSRFELETKVAKKKLTKRTK